MGQQSMAGMGGWMTNFVYQNASLRNVFVFTKTSIYMFDFS